MTGPCSSSDGPGRAIKSGERIVVRTPDQREFRGRFMEYRAQGDKLLALVRLDTGWETTYPVSMVWKDST